jgi:NNP family nitrate/nitrite transporter-like MFS transporter
MSEGAGGHIPGHRSALWAGTAAFTLCFAAWSLFSVIGIDLRARLALSDTEFGLLLGTPFLTGSVASLRFAAWAQRYGSRRLLLVAMVLAAAATFLSSLAESYPEFLLAAAGIGLAGGSLGAGFSYVGRFFARDRQAAALEIFSAGTIGAAITGVAAPFVVIAWGWRATAQLWTAALLLGALLLLLSRKDPAGAEPGGGRASNGAEFAGPSECAGLALRIL